MAVTSQDFVRRWLEEMDRRDQRDRTSYWEAEEAVREATRKYGQWLIDFCDIPIWVDELVREATVYDTLQPEVAESNRAFKSAVSLLSAFRRDSKSTATTLKRKSGPAFTLISSYLDDISEEVDRCSESLEAQHSVFWRRRLIPFPNGENDAGEIWIPSEVPDKWASPPEESYTGYVANAVRLGSDLPDPKLDPKRAIDLDLRFQLRVGWFFKLTFGGLSRVTRARLVVLVYICFDFATVNPTTGELRIRSNKKPLTVSAVYEKLKRDERRRASTKLPRPSPLRFSAPKKRQPKRSRSAR